MEENDTEPIFTVVVNAEEQYALWREDLAVPEGWTTIFGPATKAACLEHVTSVWTDMRPRSLRERMAGN